MLSASTPPLLALTLILGFLLLEVGDELVQRRLALVGLAVPHGDGHGAVRGSIGSAATGARGQQRAGAGHSRQAEAPSQDVSTGRAGKQVWCAGNVRLLLVRVPRHRGTSCDSADRSRLGQAALRTAHSLNVRHPEHSPILRHRRYRRPFAAVNDLGVTSGRRRPALWRRELSSIRRRCVVWRGLRHSFHLVRSLPLTQPAVTAFWRGQLIPSHLPGEADTSCITWRQQGIAGMGYPLTSRGGAPLRETAGQVRRDGTSTAR